MAELTSFLQHVPGTPDHLQVYVIFFHDLGEHPRTYAEAKTLSRELTKQALADATGCSPADMVLPPGPPYLVDGTCRYSLSRTTEAMALSISTVGERTGIDIEQLQTKDQAEQLIKVFHAADQRRLRTRLPGRRRPHPRKVTQAWTYKEALLKGLEVGLVRDPAADEIGSLKKPLTPQGWSLTPIPIANDRGHIASVAWETTPCSVQD